MPTSPDDPWRTCFALLAPKLLLFARQWVPSPADAEDVVQSAFVRFWRKHPDATPEHYPLLYVAVRTAALDLLRKDGRRMRREERANGDPLAAEITFFDASLEQREEAATVSAALACLPEAQREVLVLRIWGELTFQEIADALGSSINTVAARYRYGIEALRRILSPHEYERV